MSNNFKENLRQNLNIKTGEETKQQTYSETNLQANTQSECIIIKKKTDDKKSKKSFNVYMEPDLVKELDRISKKSGYSRNELINLYCRYGVERSKIED